jgi:hypothetical protein
MLKAVEYYQKANVLSLDVTAGALVCALFFAKVFSVSIGFFELTALGLTVWIIYTIDHLRDARKIPSPASTTRHRFHQVHFNTLRRLLVLAIILDTVTLYFMRIQILKWGIVLAGGVFVYLVTQQSLKFLKEILISVLFTCGILLPSVSITGFTLETIQYLLIVQFAVVALINLLLFSWFDRELDQQDRQHSFVTIVGEGTTRIIIWLLSIIQVVLTLIQLYWGQYNVAAILLGSMGLILSSIYIFREPLGKQDYYRLLGDAVFMIPVLYLI